MSSLTEIRPDWTESWRSSARQKAESINWPTKKDEEWRRTLMSRLPWTEFQPAQSITRIVERPKETGYSAVAHISDTELSFFSVSEDVRLRFWNDSDLSNWQKLLHQTEDRFFWEQISDPEETLVMEIKSRAVLEQPILVHWNQVELPHQRRSTRFQILVGPGAVAELVLRLDSRLAVFLNSLFSISIGENAVFKLTLIQSLSEDSYWVDHSFAEQADGSQFHFTLINLGTNTAKTKFNADICGQHAEFQAKGIYLCHGKQHKDMRLVQHHLAPYSLSNALFKGAVKDRGRSVFQGLIEVAKEGHKTDAYLSNKNLVLNDGARADSLPQLKIDHNDLRCTHGSTTGMVDQEQVHYLQSRGLNDQEAKVLIAMGLFQEIIDSLPASLRLPIEGQVETLLKTDARYP